MISEAPIYHGAAAAIIADAERRDATSARVWDEIKAEYRSPKNGATLGDLAAAFRRSAQDFDPVSQRWIHPVTPRLAPVKPCGRLLKLSGQWQRVGLDDDRTSEATPYDRVSEIVRQVKADREFLARCKTETGDAAGPKHTKQQRERAIVLAQSHELARRLEAQGVEAYRHDGAGLWVWWVCSQQAEQLPQFRRICFLPSVSAQVRAGKLAALEHFIACNQLANGANACRFWTFTSGKRVRVEQLRSRIEWLHAKLNKLNQWLRAQWGIELVFRSTELGSIEADGTETRQAGQMEFGDPYADKNAGRVEFDTDGAPLFHPHAHCVLHMTSGFMPNWSDLIAAVWQFWRDDAGEQLIWNAGKKGQPGFIRNAREVCKYVTKPGDMLKLSPEFLAKTEAALHGLHLVTPLGALKKEIARRRTPGQEKVLVRVPTGDGGTVWAEKDDWNKFSTQTDAEKAGAANLDDARLMAKETAAAARVSPPAIPRAADDDKAWTRIFARLAPAVGPRGIKEPRVIVGGSVFHRPTVENHPLVTRLWRHTIQDFEAGLAAEKCAVMRADWRQPDRIIVHTGTPTARSAPPGSDDEPADAWESASPVEIASLFAQ